MSTDKPYRLMRSYGGVTDCVGKFETLSEVSAERERWGDHYPFVLWIEGPVEDDSDV